eukprot:g1410.t1
MSGPGKYKDHSKAATDLKLGSIDSFDATFKTKAANGTAIEASQSVKHGSTSAVTKLSLKFKKCAGLRLESFEASTDGSMKTAVGISDVAPGVSLSAGTERKYDGKAKSHKDCAYVSGTYSTDAIVFNGKACALNRSLDLDALFGYQNFLVGAKAGFSQAKPFTGASGVLAFNWADANRVSFEANNKKEFNFATYMKPFGGVEVGVYGKGSIVEAPAAASKEGEAATKESEASSALKLDATLASKFALDNNGTSLTTSVNVNPLDIQSKCHVGLSYTQKLRNYASVTISGEVGVTDTAHVGLGAELEMGN